MVNDNYLKIGVEVDTRQAKKSVKDIQKDFKGLSETTARSFKESMNQINSKVDEVGKNIKKKLGNVKLGLGESLTTAFTAGTDANEKLKASLAGLSQNLQLLGNLQFADLISNNFDWIGKQVAKATKNLSSFTTGIQLAGISVMECVNKIRQHIKIVNNLGKSHEKVIKLLSRYDEVSKATRIIEKLSRKLLILKNTFNGLKDKLKKGLKEVGKYLKEAIKYLAESAAALGGLVGGLVLGLTALGSAIALKVSKRVKELADNSRKVGLSAQYFQEMGFVMETVGVEAEELSNFVKTLSDEQAQLIEGAEGNTAAFQELGLSIEEVKSMTQEELFKATLKGLQGVENQTQRTAIAYRIFGEDAAHLANIMNMDAAATENLIYNYQVLGGAASQQLINKSQELQLNVSYLGEAWKGLSNIIAEAFMPIINAVVKGLTYAVAAIRIFLKAVFGIESSPALSAGSGSSSMGAGMRDFTSATNDAIGAAEKFKRYTMGFDELNVIPDQDKGAGAGSGAASFTPPSFGGGASMDLPTLDIEKLDLGKFEEFCEKYKGIIHTIATISMVGIGAIGAVLALLHGNIISAIGFASMAGLGIALDLGSDNSLIKGAVDWIVEKCTWCYEQVVALPEKAKVLFHKAVDWVLDKVLKGIEIFYNGWDTLTEGASNLFHGFVDGVVGGAQWIWDKIKGVIDWIGNGISNLINGGVNILSGFIDFIWGIVSKVGNWFKNLWGGLKDGFVAAWEYIKDIFSGWGAFFSNLWDSIKHLFSEVGGKIADSIGGSIKSVINSVLQSVENKLNWFVRLLNKAIRIINKIPGVDINYLDNFELPRLAKGGIVSTSTIANIGENGKEAVLPLENNTGWMDTLADKIAARNSAPSKIVLEVDGRALAETSVKSINDLTRQTGKLELNLI